MNIAIIEKDHFEVAYTLISLFDRNGNNITVFCENESYVQLQSLLKDKASRYSWIVKSGEESNRHFIRRMFKQLRNQQFDLVYIDTIVDNFILYAHLLRRLKASRQVLTMHGINEYFHYSPSLNIRRFVRWIGKRRLINSFNEFNVLSDTMIDHLREKIPSTLHIFNIPGGFYDPSTRQPLSFTKGNTIRIVIPGLVDTVKRNYETVFELLNKSNETGISLSVTLLGSFSKDNGSSLKERCQAYNKIHGNLRIYESMVPQEEFDQVVRQSHFVWMPLNPSFINRDGVEGQNYYNYRHFL